jgi:hypothetical protein
MDRITFSACLFLCCFLLSGCRQANLTYDKPYFDFDSLINVQITYLATRQDSVRKIASIDGKEDQSLFLADSAQLAHEWDVFRQLDVMNKPAYKGHYRVTEMKDAKSNLMVRLYTCEIKSSVPVVRFYYQNQLSNVKRIESQYIEQNALYYTTRSLSLSLEGDKDRMYIYDYAVNGIQKMIFSDTVRFSTHARILK